MARHEAPLANQLGHFPTTGCLVAGMPHLLGFVPEDSVIVVALGDEPNKPVIATMRVDLPRGEDVAARDALVDWIDQPMAHATGASSALRVFIWTAHTEREDDDFLRRINDALQARTGLASESAIVVAHPESTQPPTWRTVTQDDEHHRSPEAHQVTEADRQRALALFAVGERSPAPSRGVLESELDPVSQAGQWHHPPSDVDDEAFEVAVAHAMAVLHGHIVPVGIDLSLLTSALMDVQVRDTVIHDLMTDPKRRWAVAAEVLATAVRLIPDRSRAPLATCLAILRWQMGDGSRAMIAVDAAIDADSEYALAHLVGGCVSSGLHPEVWRRDLEALPRRVCAGGRG